MKKALFIAAILVCMYPSVMSGLDNNKTAGVLRAEVIADEAEIFLEASQHSIVIDTIPRGTTVTLFSSGRKDKKWLYISYLSKKRGAKVTGFVDSHRVEIIKESPPDEQTPSEVSVGQHSEEKNPEPGEKKTQEVEKELEEFKNLLKKMENENQEGQALEEQVQEVEDKRPEEVLQQEQTDEEQETSTEEMETQEEKNQEKTEAVEKVLAEEQEETKEVPTDESDVSTMATEEETLADETASNEKVRGTETEETESQNVNKEEKAEDQEENAQKQQEAKVEEQAIPAQEEAVVKEEAPVEMEPETEEKELPKVLTKVSVNVPRANIRLMPTTQSPIINQVHSGTELQHQARTGNWHRVNLAPNKDGIVLSGYIHKNIVDEVYETIVPPPIPEKIFDEQPEAAEDESDSEFESNPEPVKEIPAKQTSRFEEYYWVGGGAGYTMPSQSQFGKGFNFGGTFGFGVMEHLAVELRVPFFQSDVIGSANGLSSGRLSQFSLMLSVQGRYTIKNRFIPYLVAGGGFHLHTFRLNEEITHFWSDRGFNIQESVNHTFGFHFGAGLDVFLKQNIAVNLDVRYHTASLTGKRTLANQASQESITGTINNMKLNSLQLGISVKLFLRPLTKKK